MIQVDVSEHSTVVACSACRSWSVLASSRDAAWRIGSEHERSVHPETYQAREAEFKRRLRSATRRAGA